MCTCVVQFYKTMPMEFALNLVNVVLLIREECLVWCLRACVRACV